MIWNFNMIDAPRDGTSKVIIAVMGVKKVRWCVWNKADRKWSGLLSGETPLAFVTVTHPDTKSVKLPEGMNL